MTSLLPDEKRNISIVLSKLIECVLCFEIFMIVLEPRSVLIYNFVDIRKFVLVLGNFSTCYTFSNRSIEVLMLFKCLFIFFLVTFSLFYQLLKLLSSLFTSFHDFFFLNLMLFKFSLRHFNLACIKCCQE